MPNEEMNEELNEEKRVMKNPNEYRIGDRLYVNEIKRCRCEEKNGNEYVLWCRIHQRGENYYFYMPGTGCLRRPSDKRLYLSEAAQMKVEETVRRFDEETSEEVLNYYVKFGLLEGEVTIYYRRLSYSYFSAVRAYRDGEGVPHKKYYPEINLKGLIVDLSCGLSPSWLDLFPDGVSPIQKLSEGTAEGLEANPLYLSAGAAGDVLLQKQLKLVYRLASPEECAWLAEKEGQPVLPPLSKEYDKDYYVTADSIPFPLLHSSGYRVLHRPSFAMKNSTRAVLTINPYAKTCLDAAPKDAEAIGFAEYLELFAESSLYSGIRV